MTRRVKVRDSLTRRQMLGTLGAAAAAVGVSGVAQGQTQTQGQVPAPTARRTPPREFLLRGGRVLTVDPTLGDLPVGDVHIRDGVIVAVAPRVTAPGARVIDATGMLVLPGFVDTHFHMWNTIWRGMANDASEYFGFQRLAANYTVDDHYLAVLYAGAEALSAGFTTTHNWAHGVRSYADLEAEMRALTTLGLRARQGYVGVVNRVATSADDLRRALAWIATNGQGRLSLSMLLDGAGDQFASQVKVARELGLKTITDHGGFMAFPDLIGPDFLYTHGTALTAEQVALIARRGIKVGLCPGTDPMIGAGLPPIDRLITGGVPLANISMTLDVTAQTPADPFAMLRTLVNAGRIQQAGSGDLQGIARANTAWRFTYDDALRVGTLSGANVLGLADLTGSLTPGKRADVIMVRTSDPNMLPLGPSGNAAMQLIQHGLPSNVDTVFVDGVLRKRAGRLVGIDQAKLAADAAAAQLALRRRAGLA